VESTLAVEPSAERAAFRGQVWLLVGQQTGGDGVGALDPIFMRLPNSGLLIQFTMMYGLNPDVSGSKEAGTTPDVPSPAGEPALVTALRAITAGDGQTA